MKVSNIIIAVLIIFNIAGFVQYLKLDKEISELKKDKESVTSDSIAESLVQNSTPELVDLLMKDIINNKEYVDTLKSSTVSELLASKNGLDIMIEEMFWKNRKPLIIENQELIASIAEEVVSKYKDELKGETTKAASPNDIAKILSENYEFALLVSSFKNIKSVE